MVLYCCIMMLYHSVVLLYYNVVLSYFLYDDPDRNSDLFEAKSIRVQRVKQTNDDHNVFTEKFRKVLTSEEEKKLMKLIKQKLIYQSLCLKHTVKLSSLVKVKCMKQQQKKSENLIQDSMTRFVTATKLEHETATV